MEVTEAMLRTPKSRAYYGVSLLVPVAPTRAHLQVLTGSPYYMSIKQIATRAGVTESNVCQILKGRRGTTRGYETIKSIYRDTEAALMGVEPEINPPKRGGGHVPPLGTVRRFQALVAAGYPLSYLSEGIGWGADPQPVHRMIRGKSGAKYVMHSTYMKVCALYDKLQAVDPSDMGFKPTTIGRARSSARKHGYAPPACWDDDTIDDPEAWPEWTGACGTEEGYRIHLRELMSGDRTMMPCLPCRKAGEGVSNGGEFVFRLDRYRELWEESGSTLRRASEATGISPDSIFRWKRGDYQPKYLGHVQKLATYFGVELEALADMIPAGEWIPPEPGSFNRHVMAALLDLTGMSKSMAAKICGVSPPAVENWTGGKTKPADKERLVPLARKLGVDVEVFYS